MEENNFAKLKKIVDSLSVNEEFEIKVNPKDVLETRTNNIKKISMDHFDNLVEKKGYPKVKKALNNLKHWNSEKQSMLADIDAIIKKLDSKYLGEDGECGFDGGLGDLGELPKPKLAVIDIKPRKKRKRKKK